MEHFSHAMAFADPLTIEGIEKRTPLQTIRAVLPFLWPKDRRDMQSRVVIALGCLLVGRMANVYGPIVLKDLIDGLESLMSGPSTDQALASLLLLLCLTGPAFLLSPRASLARWAIFRNLRRVRPLCLSRVR